MIVILISTLVVLIAAVLLYYISQLKQEIYALKVQHIRDLQDKISQARKEGKQRSGAVQWGLAIENFVPFMDEFPIPVEAVTFLGKPIDYVGYTQTDSKQECAVHFVEVKSGRSQLLPHQRNIKEAIKAGRVYWHEIRVGSNKEQ